MNAHIYATEYHTPLNKTTSFSFHLKSSQCAYLQQGVVDFWDILKELLSNYWFYNIGKSKNVHTPNKLSSGQHKLSLIIWMSFVVCLFALQRYCSNGLKLKYICTLHVQKFVVGEIFFKKVSETQFLKDAYQGCIYLIKNTI